MISRTYSVADLFSEIPNDPDNELMTLPPEVMIAAGFKPGDRLHFTVVDGTMVIRLATDDDI